jgi:hypothetical protein
LKLTLHARLALGTALTKAWAGPKVEVALA